MRLRLRWRRFWLVVLLLFGTFGCPRPPSDGDLKDKFDAQKIELEHLARAAVSAKVSVINSVDCKPAIETATQESLRGEMKRLGVSSVSVVDGRVMLTVYTWGLAVSGVFRGFYLDPDGGKLPAGPIGEDTKNDFGRFLRVADGWYVYRQ